MANEYTKRDGTMVEAQDYVISAADMISLLRLQEDFAERGETFLSKAWFSTSLTKESPRLETTGPPLDGTKTAVSSRNSPRDVSIPMAPSVMLRP